jgi:D-alanyl-D-alanine carboxypeptidase
MELILNILCALIPLIYLVIFVAKENRRKGKKHYIYGLVVAAVLFLILFVIRLIALTFISNESTPDNTTTTTTSTTTTVEPTKESTTTKKSDYERLTTPAGGETLGTTPKGYEVKKIDGLYYVDGYLIANKTYSLPKSYNPGKLKAEVETAANKMFADAQKEVNNNMWAQSGFRSYSTQESIYNRYVSRDGQKEADTYSARPGHSEHQSGLAFDVCATGKSCIDSGFDNTKEAKWLSENAYKYGFILRYPKGTDKVAQTGYMYESWHFRYVGEDLAEKLYNNGDWITMEEYFGLTSSYDEKPIGE